jgi:hypothetical protein
MGLLAGAFIIGFFVLGQAPPGTMMLVWDGLIVAFLFFWATGLLSDLQRSESLSLNKFMHMPVSLSGVFLINYISSLLSFNLLLFAPAMVGLSIGLTMSRGPAQLIMLPLVVGLLLVVTALTYQFQGWLAALMANPRRRRTVIVVATGFFILIVQIPNLINMFHPWDRAAKAENTELVQLRNAVARGHITEEEFQARQTAIMAAQQEKGRRLLQQIVQTALILNIAVPFGWPALGARYAAEANIVPGLLGALGLVLIGGASLWRSYRTTVRLYAGGFDAAKSPGAPVTAVKKVKPPASNVLERQIPWLPERAAVIALAGLRSLLRAPEAKMMLLTPVILVAIFGSLFVTRQNPVPVAMRPLMAFAAMGMVLFSMLQLIGNQFGFDRNGFRVFVLCPARRRDILLGKNLAIAPLAAVLCAVAVLFVQCLYPMNLSLLLAIPAQFVSMYLCFCILGNLLSIIAPMRISQGTLKPANAKLVPVLLHVLLVLLFPVAVAPTLLPLGVQALLDAAGWGAGLPIVLILSLLECAVIAVVYWFATVGLGDLLQYREQNILEVVTTRAE